MERLGIFGGTFDPPHNAHLRLATEACRQLDLKHVLWVLTPDPPHKERPDLSPYPLRRQMLIAAISGQAHFLLSEVEAERPGPHYMVDTVRILMSRHPGSVFFLLLGEDSLRDLPLWHQPRDLLSQCPLVVMRRPDAAADLAALEIVLPGITDRTRFLNAPQMDISSTGLRDLVRRGKSIDEYVPAQVEEIIAREKLYSRK